MESNSAIESLEPRRRVIGLERELERLEQWLADPLAKTRLFSISGIGGIGKTTLLAEMARRCRESSALALWLDGRGELASPSVFLSSLEASLESECGTYRTPETALLPHIVAELSKQRSVLLLDNSERLDLLEGWLLSSFLPQLRSAGVLLAIASRNGLSPKWHANPHWGSRIESFPLKLFSREQSLDYLRESGLETGMQLEVARRTDGHPLLLALTVDLLRSRDRDSRSRLNDIPAMLSGDWLREASSPSLHRALTALSLLPAADQETLSELLDAPIDISAYHDLGRLSFIRSTSQGLSLHPVVSRLLREDYSRRNPGQFRTMRHKAFGLIAERFPGADRRTQMRFAAHVLELYREYLPSAHAYADFSAPLGPGGPAPYRSEDLPFLHRFLADSLARSDWQSELVRAKDCHAVLDEIARRSPEGICVVRNDKGTPIGFCAGFGLHASTAPHLTQYAPSFLPMLGEEGIRLSEASPETADTLLMLLAAVDTGQSLYRPEELGALLMQQWLIHMTSGWRGLMVSADPQLNGLLALLGFQEKRRIRQGVAAEADMILWELDFRHTTFEQWVQIVIRQTKPERFNNEPEAGCEAKIGADDVKQILRHWIDPDELERLPVLRRLRLPGTVVQARIRSILSEEPPSAPLTRLEQRILRDSFLRKDLNKNQLADAFHMSRTTFYRHSRQAMNHLAHVLNLSLQHS
ncbi:bacterio-opsin activator [Paenibacillaceae bacterium WGS1546]|uniref:bacterio-opsin activator n=1 Tax=Cohnella sp. WGS1546 TaxID=3366810 RepID=UPI00372D84CB